MASTGEGGRETAWCDGGMRALVPACVWTWLVAQGTARRYRSGEVLVRQGEPATRVLVLVEGRVKVTRCEADGSEVLLAVRGAGELIGGIGALVEGAPSATVVALWPCLTRVLPARDFVDMVRARDLALPMLRLAAARGRESEQIRVDLSTLPVSRRLIRMLLRLADALGTPTGGAIAVDLGMAQEELARAIGASRSQVAAHLRRLRGEGILSTSRRRLVVRDPARLRAIDA